MQLTCHAFYPSRWMFSCEDLSFGAIGHRDVYLRYNVMELDGARLLVLKEPKENSTPVTQTNPQTLL